MSLLSARVYRILRISYFIVRLFVTTLTKRRRRRRRHPPFRNVCLFGKDDLLGLIRQIIRANMFFIQIPNKTKKGCLFREVA